MTMALAELDQLALDAVKAAVANKPADKLSYSEVSAADVVRLAALVPPESADELVEALAAGAKGALKGWSEAKRGPLKVSQTTAHLRHLVRLVEAPAQ